MSVSLNMFYKTVGISKQNFHKEMDKQLKESSYRHQLLFLIHQIRQDHPTMGVRDMYHCIGQGFIGRDNFVAFCRDNGFSSQRRPNLRKTTDSSGVIRFPNLTVDIELNRINQLWVSDITYYELNGSFVYITFVLDAFSRMILGFKESKRLFTEQTTLPALKMAVGKRKGIDLGGTIFHSDGGGQYYDKKFINYTNEVGFLNSMCQYPWENGKAERINGIIKNNYLIHRNIETFEQLKLEVERSVRLYNEKKPHIALNRLTPFNFEKLYISTR